MNTAGSKASLHREEATVNHTHDFTLWDYLNWTRIMKQVNKLQSRIAKAVKNCFLPEDMKYFTNRGRGSLQLPC